MYYWSSSKNLRCESHIVTPTVGWSWPCTAMLKVHSTVRTYCVYKQHWDAVIGEHCWLLPWPVSFVHPGCLISASPAATIAQVQCQLLPWLGVPRQAPHPQPNLLQPAQFTLSMPNVLVHIQNNYWRITVALARFTCLWTGYDESTYLEVLRTKEVHWQ
jgi:hypothetical protein